MLKKKRWQLVFLLFLAGVVNYLDRSALSVAAPLCPGTSGWAGGSGNGILKFLFRLRHFQFYRRLGL